MQNRAPLIIAIVLLLLPVLYVGSYCALVVPGGRMEPHVPRDGDFFPFHIVHYRTLPNHAASFFSPLEQFDRMVRPDAWPDHEDRARLYEQEWKAAVEKYRQGEGITP